MYRAMIFANALMVKHSYFIWNMHKNPKGPHFWGLLLVGDQRQSPTLPLKYAKSAPGWSLWKKRQVIPQSVKKFVKSKYPCKETEC